MSATRYANTITRENQEPDTIYVAADGGAFVTPDGEGRYWYNGADEAREEHGDLPVVHVETVED